VSTPSVGRVVHYVAYGTPGGEFPTGVCRAAVITDASPLTTAISVCVLNPSGLFFNRAIPFDPAKTPGTWHWPEIVRDG
jgi:hypothetical protein